MQNNPEFISVLCRKLNYSVADFWKYLNMDFLCLKQEIQDKEQITRLEQEAIFKDIQSTYETAIAFNIIHPAHKYYPVRWSCIDRPPVFLSALGNLEFLQDQLITVIGSRRPLPAFTDWMDIHYIDFLKKNNRVTVSGGAYGIDMYATKLALFSGRNSILILPSGFKNPYPVTINKWIGHKNILCLSEYFPLEEVRKFHFLNRNRLLGSIGSHVLVVQCAVKSGSMITVKYALEAGLEVCTLPTFPGSVESDGNIKLLREGAQMITDRLDLELCVGVLAPHPDGKDEKNEVRNP